MCFLESVLPPPILGQLPSFVLPRARVGSEAEGAGATEFEDGAEENQLIPLSYHCLPAYVAPDLVPSYETLHVLESTRSP